MFNSSYVRTMSQGYEMLGYIVMASSALSVFVQIKGHPHLRGD